MVEMGCRRWRRWSLPSALFLAGILIGGVSLRSAQGVPQGGYAHPQVLIQAEELKTLLDQNTKNLKIIDVRPKAKYYLGHIPGAVQLWRPALADRPPGGAGGPGSAQLANLLGRLGVSHQDTLVIYSDLGDHAGLWWLLAYYGFPLERMRLLDGGLEAWKARGYPTQFTYPHPKRTTFKLADDSRRKSLLAAPEEVKAAPENPRKVILAARDPDNRPRGRETRIGLTRRSSALQVVEVSWNEAKVADGASQGLWKSAADLKALYAPRGVTPDKDIYIYGRPGPGAAFTLVSLYLAGYPLENLHLCPGFWEEGRSPEPVKTGKEK